MAEKLECMGAAIMADSLNFGNTPNQQKIFDAVKSLKNKTKFAAATKRNDKLIAASIDKNSPELKWLRKFSEGTGIPIDDVLTETMRPHQIMGKEITDAVYDLEQGFNKAFPNGDARNWQSEMKKVLTELEQQALATNEDFKHAYIRDYFAELRDGSTKYGVERFQTAGSKVVRNVVGNFVGNNPKIALLNLVEVVPKGLAYAMASGNPKAFLTGIKKAWQASGGKVLWRIPELEELGIYGNRQMSRFEGVRNFQEKVGFDSIIDPSENFMKNVYYYMGEEINGVNGGWEAVEELSFMYRFGNTPKYLWRNTDKNFYALMRFSVGMLQLQGKMVHNFIKSALQGDYKTAGNLLMAGTAFSVVQAIQTGTASAVPYPVDFVLPKDMQEDYKDYLAELDASLPGMNLMKLATQTDYSEAVRPFQMPSMGVGLSMAQSSMNSFGSQWQKAFEAGFEGDLLKGAVNLGSATLYGLQFGNLPFINYTTTRTVQSLVSAANDEIDWDEAHLDALKRMKLYDPESAR